MGPVRILILAVLLYIGYRLIMKNFSNSGNDQKSGKRDTKGGKITDVLVEDPICHKLVPKQQAVELETEGETHYFCSQECCDTYRSEQGDNA
jgi:YHS domain-containing protein